MCIYPKCTFVKCTWLVWLLSFASFFLSILLFENWVHKEVFFANLKVKCTRPDNHILWSGIMDPLGLMWKWAALQGKLMLLSETHKLSVIFFSRKISEENISFEVVRIIKWQYDNIQQKVGVKKISEKILKADISAFLRLSIWKSLI